MSNCIFARDGDCLRLNAETAKREVPHRLRETGGPFGGVHTVDLLITPVLTLMGRVALPGVSSQILKFRWVRKSGFET